MGDCSFEAYKLLKYIKTAMTLYYQTNTLHTFQVILYTCGSVLASRIFSLFDSVFARHAYENTPAVNGSGKVTLQTLCFTIKETITSTYHRLLCVLGVEGKSCPQLLTQMLTSEPCSLQQD